MEGFNHKQMKNDSMELAVDDIFINGLGREYSQFNNDVVYDAESDMFFTSTYKHAIGFKVNRP